MTEKKQTKSGTATSIKESLKKATTEMLVLYLLCSKPMYTYEMMSEIELRSNGSVTFNTLYQSIYRLRNFNYIQEHEKQLSDDNRLRIYFAVTDSGRAYLAELIAEYQNFTGAVDHILGLPERGAGQ